MLNCVDICLIRPLKGTFSLSPARSVSPFRVLGGMVLALSKK